MRDENYQKLHDYALKLLSFRPRSAKEIKGKLLLYSAKWRISSEVLDQVIENLSEQNFINDREFVSWWIDQRQSFRPKGFKVIKLELLRKGISKEDIDAVSTEMENETISEYDLAMKVMEKKLTHMRGLFGERLKIKIRDLLFRRGFEWETIRKVIDSLTGKSYNNT